MTEYEYMIRRADRCFSSANKTTDKTLANVFYRAGKALERKALSMSIESAITIRGRKF